MQIGAKKKQTLAVSFLFLKIKIKIKIHLTSILCQHGLSDDPIQVNSTSVYKCFNVFYMTKFYKIR